MSEYKHIKPAYVLIETKDSSLLQKNNTINMKGKLSRFILKMWGWKIGNVIPDIPKCVIALAPHTSNYDFIIGKLAYTAIGRTANFLIKESWFVFPFNLIFNSMGGIPVGRGRNTSFTDTLAKEFDKRDKFQLAITPEGTRRRITKWKRGVYVSAMNAEVPIVLIGLDYDTKTISSLDVINPTGDIDADMKIIQSKFKGIQGKYPEQFVHSV